MGCEGYEIKGLGRDGLQGQQPSAQGNTLGISNQRRAMAACKAKRSIIYIMLLPFQGVFTHTHNDPGCCPGLKSYWPCRPFEYKYTCETSVELYSTPQN